MNILKYSDFLIYSPSLCSFFIKPTSFAIETGKKALLVLRYKYHFAPIYCIIFSQSPYFDYFDGSKILNYVISDETLNNVYIKIMKKMMIK